MKLTRLLSLLCTISAVFVFVSFLLPQAAHADFTDTFTAPDGTELHAYNPIYTYVSSNSTPIYIVNNALAPSSTLDTTVVINNNDFTDGCMSMDSDGNTNMTIRSSGLQEGETTPQGFYQFYQQNGVWRLSAFYNKNYITLSRGNSLSGTHNYKLCAIGSTISAYRDGTQLASATDTGITGSGYSTFGSSATLDNLAITSVNHAPVVGAVSLSPNPVQINTSITATTTFTDADTGDTHTATIDWGDLSGSHLCNVTETNGSGSVSCSLPSGYASANVYPVAITVSDGSASGTSPTTYASVYNPTQQGIFTAGQHYSSPAGAYPQNSSLTGTVQFGLSYKYQGTVPTSNREFTMNFKAANLLFNATTISSLVISNNFATLTGTGNINGGSHTYNFLVTGVDSADIRIQITDPANNNNVIYDTQPNAAVTATPTTSVTGNVIVHN